LKSPMKIWFIFLLEAKICIFTRILEEIKLEGSE